MQQHWIVKFRPYNTHLKENLFICTLHMEFWEYMKTYPEYLQLLELNLDWNTEMISYHYQWKGNEKSNEQTSDTNYYSGYHQGTLEFITRSVHFFSLLIIFLPFDNTLIILVAAKKSRTFFQFLCLADEQMCRSWEGT